MGAAKSGGQEVRVGEVFMECAEKKRFPGFGFFWQGDNCALRGEDGSQRGKCNSQDHTDGGWVSIFSLKNEPGGGSEATRR
jgi:hypothetical protein